MNKKSSKIKTVSTIEAGECRWPIGDPRDADFHFCGAHQALGRPYCEHHWSQAFVSAKPRLQGTVVRPLLSRRAA